MKSSPKNLLIFPIMLVFFYALPTLSWGQCVPSRVFDGVKRGEAFGTSVASAGDVDNDGISDVIVGSPSFRTSTISSGKVQVYSGKTGLLLFTILGKTSGSQLGMSVAGIGDINGDGRGDILIGAPGGFLATGIGGQAFIYSGRTQRIIRTFTAEAAVDQFGTSVASAGDVNSDGVQDIIVGAMWNDAGGVNTGRAYVYSGANGNMLHKFTGIGWIAHFGFSVSGAGDVNNDGFDDLIVGAFRNNAAGSFAGRAYVYSGLFGDVLHIFDGEAPGDRFGLSVSGAGDVNNDGYDDLLIGAPLSDARGEDAGKAYVYSGSSGELLHSFVGEAAGDQFGASVSDVGDVNVDGFADFIVGAGYNDVGGIDAGRAYVFSGATGGQLSTFTGESQYDHFGSAVSNADNANFDGYPDVVIGARSNSAAIDYAGRVYVYYMGDLDGNSLIELCSSCCNIPGDFNHDGLFNIADVTSGIDRVFNNGPAPACQDEADTNGNHKFNISDITRSISRMFAAGVRPICGTTGS